MCQVRGLAVPATIADHIEPHRGDWTLTSELQSLCAHCHNSAKRRIELGRPRPDIGEDGYPKLDSR
jgi:5-methylcytosine-specific restriction enzyme A